MRYFALAALFTAAMAVPTPQSDQYEDFTLREYQLVKNDKGILSISFYLATKVHERIGCQIESKEAIETETAFGKCTYYHAFQNAEYYFSVSAGDKTHMNEAGYVVNIFHRFPDQQIFQSDKNKVPNKCHDSADNTKTCEQRGEQWNDRMQPYLL